MKLRNWIGIILMILAIPVALYVGGWVLFIGGVIQVVEALKATPIEALGIAIGLLRVLCASAVGIFTFWVGFIFGASLANS